MSNVVPNSRLIELVVSTILTNLEFMEKDEIKRGLEIVLKTLHEPDQNPPSILMTDDPGNCVFPSAPAEGGTVYTLDGGITWHNDTEH